MSTLDQVTINKARRLIRRGNFRLKAGELEDAYNAFEKVLEYFPNSPEIISILGKILYNQKKYEEATRLFRDSLNIEESDDVKELLASSLISSGHYEEAIDILEAVKKQDGFIRGLLGIAKAYHGTDLIEATKLLKNTDDTTFFQKFLGYAYFKQGHFSNAITYFRNDVNDWRVIHALAVCYFISGSNQIASRKLDEAKSLYLSNISIKERNDNILKKFEFDTIILSHSATDEVKLRKLNQIVDYIDKNETTIFHHLALLVAYYDLYGFDKRFKGYMDLIRTKEGITEETLVLFDEWEEEIKEDED